MGKPDLGRSPDGREIALGASHLERATSNLSTLTFSGDIIRWGGLTLHYQESGIYRSSMLEMLRPLRGANDKGLQPNNVFAIHYPVPNHRAVITVQSAGQEVKVYQRPNGMSLRIGTEFYDLRPNELYFLVEGLQTGARFLTPIPASEFNNPDTERRHLAILPIDTKSLPHRQKDRGTFLLLEELQTGGGTSVGFRETTLDDMSPTRRRTSEPISAPSVATAPRPPVVEREVGPSFQGGIFGLPKARYIEPVRSGDAPTYVFSSREGDSASFDPTYGLVTVADGEGTGSEAKAASTALIRQLNRALLELPDNASLSEYKTAVTNAVSNAVVDMNDMNLPGSTFATAKVTKDGRILVANVGDSEICHFAPSRFGKTGTLTRLTELDNSIYIAARNLRGRDNLDSARLLMAAIDKAPTRSEAEREIERLITARHIPHQLVDAARDYLLRDDSGSYLVDANEQYFDKKDMHVREVSLRLGHNDWLVALTDAVRKTLTDEEISMVLNTAWKLGYTPTEASQLLVLTALRRVAPTIDLPNELSKVASRARDILRGRDSDRGALDDMTAVVLRRK